MRQSTFFRNVFLSLALVSWLIFATCEQKKSVDQTKKTDSAMSENDLSAKQSSDELSTRDKNLDILLNLIVEKEIEIKLKEKELEAKIAALNAKQADLDSIQTELKAMETRLKSYRYTTYLILLVGLLLVVFGVTKILQRHTGSSESAAPKKRSEEKKSEKDQSQKEKKVRPGQQ